MPERRFCVICGQVLPPPHTTVCAERACKRARATQLGMARYYALKSGRSYAGQDHQPCKVCGGNVLRGGSSGPWPSYCSPTCRRKARAQEMATRRAVARPPRPVRYCEYCSTQLPLDAPQYRRFCDKRCRWRATCGVPVNRVCLICSQPIDDSEHGQRIYCSRSCKDKANYRRNKRKIAAKVRQWKEANRGYHDAWHARYRAENRDNLNAACRARYQANPLPYKSARDLRRAQALQTPGPHRFAEKDWQHVLRHYRWSCAYCGSKDRLEKEHVIPLSRMGRDQCRLVKGPVPFGVNHRPGFGFHQVD